MYLLHKAPHVEKEEDYTRNYGLCVIFMSTLLLQMKDTCKEGIATLTLLGKKMDVVPFTEHALIQTEKF